MLEHAGLQVHSVELLSPFHILATAVKQASRAWRQVVHESLSLSIPILRHRLGAAFRCCFGAILDNQ
jgi:hypothetical protein